ncbi:hypothetical protein [Williamsia sp. 1135]|uniref:hypothetical protein n=1 Tax=Williamsia sp. 1135 TaxID=1889262 RepID=UPI003204C0EB
MSRGACAERRPTERHGSPRLAAAAVILALVAIVAGCGEGSSGDVRGSSRVSTTADGLLLDGRPWWPIGLNAYQLGTDWTVNNGCGAQVDLDSYFGALPEDSVTRFNLFASMAVDKDTHETDFSRLDSIFDAAGRHDQLLVPVLASGEGACEDAKFKDHPVVLLRMGRHATGDRSDAVRPLARHRSGPLGLVIVAGRLGTDG